MLLMLPFTTHHRPTASNSIQVKMTIHKNYVLRIYYKYMHIKLSKYRATEKKNTHRQKQNNTENNQDENRIEVSSACTLFKCLSHV